MTLRILVAPSGFKESLDANQVSYCISQGILRAIPEAQIKQLPLVDGGEGFAQTLVETTRGTLHHLTVTGPVGQPVEAHYGFLGGTDIKTAVLEMAAAAGLRLVPRDARDPLKTTTYGVGELIKAALDGGAERILVGCGDSGTNDGGAGMAQALGVKFLDTAGQELGLGGSELAKLARIDLSKRDRRLSKVQIDVACNWHNVLCGPRGVARVFGPQKGASPEVVEKMVFTLDNYAHVIEKDLGVNVRQMSGGGASGGLGTGLHALLGANLYSRYDIVMKYLEIDSLLQDVDLVFTAEGSIDFQTPRGKIPAEVARRAKFYQLPVVVLAGTIGQGAAINLDYGIDSFSSILETPCTLLDAIATASELVTNAAERVSRLLLVGQRLKPQL